MAHSIRISDDLYELTQRASQALARPLAQQLEYWARLGAALDAAGISSGKAMALLGNGVAADEFLAVALGQVVVEDDGMPILKEHHRQQLEDVAAGRRTVQSLMAAQRSDLEGFVFTPNPASEFERTGQGW